MELERVIRQLREERGWSQEELAHRTLTSAANISRLENGKHGPSMALLERLGQSFGLQVYQLIALAENVSNPQVPPPIKTTSHEVEEEEVLNSYRRMGRKKREIFRSLGAILAQDGF